MASETLRRVGLMLVVVGALALVTQVVAFSSVSANRAANLTVVDDPDAYLGMKNASDLGVGTFSGTGNVSRITNNLNQDLHTLDVDVTITNDDDRLAVSDGFDGSLAAGDSTKLELSCQRGGSGTATIQVDVPLASGTAVNIEGASISFDLDYDCQGRSGGGGPGNGNGP